MWTSVINGRRRVRPSLRWAVAATAVTLLAACSGGSDSPSASGDTKAAAESESSAGPVEFWGWVPGLEDLVKEWNTANPDIPVTFHRMTGDDGAKVEAAVDAGAGPDVVQLSTHNLPDYVIKKRVVDISKYVSETEDLYTPASWKAVSFGEGIYGVPQGNGPTALLYRQDLFDKYKIAVPKTWDEYEAAAAALHKADPKVYLAAFSPGEIGQWVQEVSQAGGSYFGIQGDAWDVTVDNEASQKVAARWQRLLDAKLVKVSQMWTPDYWADVNSGKIATISYAAWFPVLMQENAKKLSGKWRIAPQPTYDGTAVTGDSGGAADVVLKGAKNVKGAAEFLTWINSSPKGVNTLIDKGGIFPTTKIGLTDPALKKKFDYYGGQAIYDVFAEATLHVPATWTDGPANGQVDSDLTDGFGKVANGKSTFAEVLKSVDASTVERLKGMGLSVAGAQ